MGQLVQMPVNTGGLTRRDPRRLALFRNGPGKELQGTEIDEAIEWCEIYGANPFVKDIYFFVFDASDPAKRRVVPVLSIQMYRKIAARTERYLPDDTPPVFTYDEALQGPDNPRGIIDCTVRIKVYRQGEWHWVSERIRWDERAPIIEDAEHVEWVDTGEKWADSGKPKRKKVTSGEVVRKLDPKKQNWITMGETMHAKCTEAAAIRKAFPNETAGSYAPEELDWARTIEGTAIDITNRYEAELRQKVIGGPSVTLDWCDGTPLAFVSVGQVHDRIVEWISDPNNAGKAQLFRDRNVVGLREYWAHDKAAALDVRKMLDAAIAAEAAE
jgi:phage recombination protein Bet